MISRLSGALWRSRETRAQAWLLSPLVALEGLYRLGSWLHRQAYARGLRRQVRLPARVISVGNLAVGGSAKTPLVAWLARELRARGRKVVVLSRGVGARRGGLVNAVSDGERLLLGPAEAGDEPVWMAAAAPGVPVLAGHNRVALGLRGLAVFGAEVLILDDGFQHHRLARDLDLVCIDARLGLGNLHVLPRGPLREAPGALARAHALVLTRAGSAQAEPPGAERLPARLPRFRIQIAARELRDLASGERSPLGSLQGARVGLVCAIARPDRMRDDLVALGAEVVAERAYRDHHLYTRGEIDSLDPGLAWITTAKDAVKIPAAWCQGLRVLALEEALDAASGAPLLEWVLGRLDQPRRTP